MSLTALKVSKFRVLFSQYFHALGMNTKIYEVSLRIQFDCRKIQARKIPNTDTFYKLTKSNYSHVKEHLGLCFTKMA